MKKERLRAALLHERNGLAAEARDKLSRRIAERLLVQEEFRLRRTIMFYVSVRGEVETHRLIRESVREGKRVAVPWCDRDRGLVRAAEIRDFDRDLAVGTFSIPAPREDHIRPVPVKEIELFIVPGIGFDWHGVRLGWGMGYYDRFLAGADPRAVKIGIAYERQVLPVIERDGHDVLMDKIITEDRVIDCAKIRRRMTNVVEKGDVSWWSS